MRGSCRWRPRRSARVCPIRYPYKFSQDGLEPDPRLSDFDFHAVETHLDCDFVLAAQHFASEMRQYHPPHFKLIMIGGEQRIIEIKVELGAFIVSAFAQKQVGA